MDLEFDDFNDLNSNFEEDNEEDNFESRSYQEQLEYTAKQNKLLFEALLQNDELKKARQELKAIGVSLKSNKPIRKRIRTSFHAKTPIALEPRKSARLVGKTPDYRGLLDDEPQFDRYDKTYLTETVHLRRKSIKMNPIYQRIVPVEEITSEYISNVAKTSTKKTYDLVHGTSCHQCRQKTRDSKTYCRSGFCIGVRGQLCGPCLKNRYGEDAVAALLDPEWTCPLCRGICNCSICRAKEGKRPTGILAPIALERGHVSVHHFLVALNGTGDYPEDDKVVKDEGGGNKGDVMGLAEDVLLGFNSEEEPVMMGLDKFLDKTGRDWFLIGFGDNKEAFVNIM